MKYRLYYYSASDDCYYDVVQEMGLSFHLSHQDFPYVTLTEEQALILKLKFANVPLFPQPKSIDTNEV